MRYGKRESLRRDKNAVAPAVSTVILTAAVVVMILVAATYASTFLDKRLAENEYSANKQFMLTTGLQLDDIAWTIGRTQTIRYSSRYGTMAVKPAVIRYTVTVDGTPLFSEDIGVTGILMFNMPVPSYSVGNGYFERVVPAHSDSILQNGTSASACHVLCVEKLPMSDGSYTRIVLVPTIRLMNTTISREGGLTTTYYKFYLPRLVPSSEQRYLSQSVTLVGENVTKYSVLGDNQVTIDVEFLESDFNNDFFQFEGTSETMELPDNSVVEFYVGTVSVKIGDV
ncbi:MAG: hypothetical protein NWF09_00660 [Candidatus Bathyarchaeota archaeon]|nr:hypothetical protein [Candidatus Bathyarchaeota archaeon]